MKTNLHSTRDQRGLATVVVLILMLLMSALIVSNSRALEQLRREIKLTEQKQLNKFNAAQAVPKTSPNPTQP